MKHIEKEELKQWIDSNKPGLHVMEILPASEFNREHLPCAENLPLNEEFEEKVRAALTDLDAPIVVYCSNSKCMASPTAGRRLEAMGYRDVYHYAGGKEEWRLFGYPLEHGTLETLETGKTGRAA